MLGNHPLFLLRHFEARIMVIATVLSAAIGVLLHKAKGMTDIPGLMHAPWLVAVYFLLTGIVAEGVSGFPGCCLEEADILCYIY
jgi:hypothetical protein